MRKRRYFFRDISGRCALFASRRGDLGASEVGRVLTARCLPCAAGSVFSAASPLRVGWGLLGVISVLKLSAAFDSLPRTRLPRSRERLCRSGAPIRDSRAHLLSQLAGRACREPAYVRSACRIGVTLDRALLPRGGLNACSTATASSTSLNGFLRTNSFANGSSVPDMSS